MMRGDDGRGERESVVGREGEEEGERQEEERKDPYTITLLKLEKGKIEKEKGKREKKGEKKGRLSI